MGVWSLLRAAAASLPRVTDCFRGPGIKTAPDTRGCLRRPLVTASRLSRQCYMASEPPSPSGQGPEPLRVSAMSSFTNTGLVHFCMVTFSPPEARPKFCVQGNGATPVIIAHFAGGCTAESGWRVSGCVDGCWQSPTRGLAVRSWGLCRFRPGRHRGRRAWAVRRSVRHLPTIERIPARVAESRARGRRLSKDPHPVPHCQYPRPRCCDGGASELLGLTETRGMRTSL